jgi:hypothetical protein
MKIQLSYESSPGTLMATDRIHPFWEARVVTETGGPISMVQAGRGSTPEEAIGSLILSLKDGPLVTVEVPTSPGRTTRVEQQPPDLSPIKKCDSCGGEKFHRYATGEVYCHHCGAKSS